MDRMGSFMARLDGLMARWDAVKRRCTTGYSCGSSCISVQKECRKETRSSASKERIGKLQQLARGEVKPRGIGVIKPAEAKTLAQKIQGHRNQKAHELREQRAESAGMLIPTGLPFTPEVAARIREGIVKRTIRTGAVNYGPEDLAEALLKVAQEGAGLQGENARKALAFMEEAGIMVNIAAVDKEEIRRTTGKEAGTPEIPWNDGRKLAKMVREMGLVSDERMSWYEQDTTQAGRAFLKKAQLVRNPVSAKPDEYEIRAKQRLEGYIADLEKAEADFTRGVQQGWRFEEDREGDLSYYRTAVKEGKKIYKSLKDGRNNQLKWAAQELMTSNTKGLANSDSGGFYVFGQKAYVAKAGDGKGFDANLRVDAKETDPKRLRSTYSNHLRNYLPERLEAMDKKGADYWLISQGPIGYKGNLTGAEQAIGVHIHELGHVVDSFAGVRPRSTVEGKEQQLMHETRSERLAARPPEVMELLQDRRGPSAYSLTNDYELFAESFSAYVFAPRAFQQEHPELYDWVDTRLDQARQVMAKHGRLKFNENW